MEPVSSVTAFLARYAAAPAADADAASVLAVLDDEELLVLRARDLLATERLAWLEERTGEAWGAARFEHTEQRLAVRLRRELQRRGLWL